MLFLTKLIEPFLTIHANSSGSEKRYILVIVTDDQTY